MRVEPVTPDTLYARILANTLPPENEQGCWIWTGRLVNKYPAMSVRTQGRRRTLRPYRLILVLLEVRGEGQYIMPLYSLYTYAGFELHHHCRTRRCCNPDHVEWLTPEDHVALHQKEDYAPNRTNSS